MYCVKITNNKDEDETHNGFVYHDGLNERDNIISFDDNKKKQYTISNIILFNGNHKNHFKINSHAIANVVRFLEISSISNIRHALVIFSYYGILRNVRLILCSMIDNKNSEILDIALMAAITENHMEVASLLIREGANIHLMDYYIDLFKFDKKEARHAMCHVLSMENDIILSYQLQHPQTKINQKKFDNFVCSINKSLVKSTKIDRLLTRCVQENKQHQTIVLPEQGDCYYEPYDKLFIEKLSQYQKTKSFELCAFFGIIRDIQIILREHKTIVDLDTALLCAIQFHHSEIIDLLIKNGANVHIQKDKALTIAIEYKNYDIINMLTKKYTHIYAFKENGLGTAIACGYVDIVNCLINNGADCDFNDGIFLNKCCMSGDYPNIIKLLLDNSATMNTQSKIESAYRIALLNDYLDSVTLLFKMSNEIGICSDFMDNNSSKNTLSF